MCRIKEVSPYREKFKENQAGGKAYRNCDGHHTQARYKDTWHLGIYIVDVRLSLRRGTFCKKYSELLRGYKHF